MNIMRWDHELDIQHLERLLKQNRIVLTSGDTVLGLLGQISHASYQRLNVLKKRSDKPYLVLLSSADKLSLFIDQPLTDKIQQLIDCCWPGPLTLIFRARKDLPCYMKHTNGTIAMRVPNHAGLQVLLQAFDGLFSTSANVHTVSVPEQIKQIDSLLLDQVAAVCVDRSDNGFKSLPSTILDCSSDIIRVVREGAGMSEELKKLII